MENKFSNISIIVGAFFFFSFLVFFLAEYDAAPQMTTITGAVVLDDGTIEDSTYTAGAVLTGEVLLTIEGDEFLPYEEEATLLITDEEGNEVAEETVDYDTLFAETAMAQTTNDLGEVGFSAQGEQAFDIEPFDLVIEDPGQYEATLTFTFVDSSGVEEEEDVTWDLIVDASDWCESDAACGANAYCTPYNYCAPKECTTAGLDEACPALEPYCALDTYSCGECLDDSHCSAAGETCSLFTHRCRDADLPELYETLFVNLDTYEYSFIAGDTVACVANMSANTANLSAKIYQPGDTVASPTFSYVPSDFVCDDNSPFMCWVEQEVTEGAYGQWGCAITASNEYGEDFAIAPRPLTMGNTPPEQTEDIPDVNLSTEVVYELFDLDDYFEDAEDDALGFAWRGEDVVVNIDSDHQVGIRGDPEDELDDSGWVVFTVTDGYTEIESNIVNVEFNFVYSGAAPLPTSDCVEDWQCTEWSDWDSDVRTRTCTDMAFCGTVADKPQESQQRTMTGGSSGATSQPFSGLEQRAQASAPEQGSWMNLMWILFGLLLVTAIALLAVFYVKKKQHAKEAAAKKAAEAKKAAVKKEPVKKPVAQPVTKPVKGVSPQKMVELEKFFLASLQHGEQLPAIKKKAQVAGWPVTAIEQAAKTVSLKQYIDVKLKQGYTAATLKKSLLAKGWKKETVEHIFSLR